MGIPDRAKTVRVLFNLQSGCCFYCEKEMLRDKRNDPRSVTVDHIVPVSKGGKNSPYNYVLACKSCNEEKADKALVVFIMEKRRRVSNLKFG